MKKTIALLVILSTIVLTGCTGNIAESTVYESEELITETERLEQSTVSELTSSPNTTDAVTEAPLTTEAGHTESVPETTKEPAVTEKFPEANTESATKWDSYLEAYRDLIHDLKTLTDCKDSITWDKFKIPSMRCNLDYRMLHIPIADQGVGYEYVLHDMNADGIPELFWIGQYNWIIALFTYYNDNLILVDAFWSRHCATLYDNGMFSVTDREDIHNTDTVFSILEKGKLKSVYIFAVSNMNFSELTFYESSTVKIIKITEDSYFHIDKRLPDSSILNSMVKYSLDHIPVSEDNSLTSTAGINIVPYKQKGIPAGQKIYNGPGYDYDHVDGVEESGIYTMIAEITDKDGNIWGKFKSGRGWVDLTEVRKGEDKVVLTVEKASQTTINSNNYHHYVIEGQCIIPILFRVNKKIQNVSFWSVDYATTGKIDKVYFTIDSIDASKPLLIDVPFFSDVASYVITFTDTSGKYYAYEISESMKDGSIVMYPYKG